MNGGGLQELLHSLHDVHVRMKKHNLQFQVEDKKCESNLIKQTNEIKRSCQQSLILKMGMLDKKKNNYKEFINLILKRTKVSVLSNKLVFRMIHK